MLTYSGQLLVAIIFILFGFGMVIENALRRDSSFGGMIMVCIIALLLMVVGVNIAP